MLCSVASHEANIVVVVVVVAAAAAAVLDRSPNRNRKIEDVESTLDQIRDQIEDHEDVSLAMSEGIGQNESIDMGELENELAELEMEGLDSQLSKMPSTPSSVPAGKAGAKQPAKGKSEAQELKELEKMMAL